METIKLIFVKGQIVQAMVGKTGSTFQEFFVSFAKKKWGSKFETLRNYGNIGDRKCDGRITEEGTYFQCYAPYAAIESKINAKIKGDFLGALKHWGGSLKTWVFVINDREGLDAASDMKVQSLREKYADIKFEVFGPHEFEDSILKMTEAEISGLFGVSLTEIDPRKWEFSFEDVDAVVHQLDLSKLPPDVEDNDAPPINKIEINGFSDSVATLIRNPERFTVIVQNYFRSVADVTLENRVAAHFNSMYVAFKSNGLDSDTIFFRIVDCIQIMSKTKNQREAGFALITYLFRNCVIFEPVEMAT